MHRAELGQQRVALAVVLLALVALLVLEQQGKVMLAALVLTTEIMLAAAVAVLVKLAAMASPLRLLRVRGATAFLHQSQERPHIALAVVAVVVTSMAVLAAWVAALLVLEAMVKAMLGRQIPVVVLAQPLQMLVVVSGATEVQAL